MSQSGSSENMNASSKKDEYASQAQTGVSGEHTEEGAVASSEKEEKAQVMEEAAEDYQTDADSEVAQSDVPVKSNQDENIPQDAHEDNVVKKASILEAATGAWSSCFNALAKGGPVFLFIALFCMSWHDFYKPDNAVYCPVEFKAITAFLHCVAQGSWLAPIGLDNGAWTIAQWPGFFWFTGLVALIPGVGASSILLPIAEFTAAALAVLGIWWLAHACNFGSRAAFAAGVMALACPLFAPLPHFMGAAALATAFFLFSLIFFYRGWTREHAYMSLPLGFIFTALAGLTGGLLFFAVPLVASLCFIIWRGEFKRGQRLDALIGFVLLLIIAGGWLGWVMLDKTSPEYLSLLFQDSLDVSLPLRPFWWAALVAGFFGTMPWLLTIFGVSWIRVLKDTASSFSASRHENGSAMIWISLILCAICCIWIPQFHPAAVSIASLFLILLGKAFLRMPTAGNRFFFAIASLLTTCVGLLLLAMHFDFTQDWILSVTQAPIPQIARDGLKTVTAVAVIGGILVLGGLCGFYFARRNQHSGGLLYALLLAIILCQPGRLMLVPEVAANPELPVRTFDFISSEVEKSLSYPVTLPDAIPVPENGESVMPEEATVAPDQTPGGSEDSFSTLGQPNKRGSSVAPASQESGIISSGPDLGERQNLPQNGEAENQQITAPEEKETLPEKNGSINSEQPNTDMSGRLESGTNAGNSLPDQAMPAQPENQTEGALGTKLPSLDELREIPKELPGAPEVNLPKTPVRPETSSPPAVIEKEIVIEEIKPTTPENVLPAVPDKQGQ